MEIMDRQTRINHIVKIVQERQGASVRALSEELGVTEMTIRRDIAHLKACQAVKLVSGAVLPDVGAGAMSDPDKYDLSIQKEKHMPEKYKIGKAAAALIEQGDVIFIDIGTTTSCIIQHVSAAAPVTVVCCTMNALLETQKKGISDIILTGGTYREDVQMFESQEGEELLRRTRITKAFISAAGVNEKLGATCVNNCEVGTKIAAMKGALEKILVADSTKFGLVKPAFFADLSSFDAVVTDGGITDEWRKLLEAKGIRLYIA